jgi:hypothetical protein
VLQETESRTVRLRELVDRMGEMRNAYKILVGKPEGKRSLRRPRDRSGDKY